MIFLTCFFYLFISQYLIFVLYVCSCFAPANLCFFLIIFQYFVSFYVSVFSTSASYDLCFFYLFNSLFLCFLISYVKFILFLKKNCIFPIYSRSCYFLKFSSKIVGVYLICEPHILSLSYLVPDSSTSERWQPSLSRIMKTVFPYYTVSKTVLI